MLELRTLVRGVLPPPRAAHRRTRHDGHLDTTQSRMRRGRGVVMRNGGRPRTLTLQLQPPACGRAPNEGVRAAKPFDQGGPPPSQCRTPQICCVASCRSPLADMRKGHLNTPSSTG